MSDENDARLTFRLPSDLLDRLDDLRSRIEAVGVGSRSVPRSEAARVALERGIEALEDELPEDD